MLDQLTIPEDHVHPIISADQDVQASAQAYEQELRNTLPHTQSGMPQFDVMLQGIGDDGHTASLFPGTSILQERDQWVAAVQVAKLDAWRISVTFPVINHARCIIMLVAGAGKAAIMHEVLVAPPSAMPYPVQMIQPQGELHWYMDKAAAAQLPADLIDSQQA
jgi:6-phosphogluconolactonase